MYCNFSATDRDLPTDLPKFYRDCLAVWCYLAKNDTLLEKQVIDEILWNKNIEKLEKLKIGRFALKGRVQYSRNHEAVT